MSHLHLAIALQVALAAPTAPAAAQTTHEVSLVRSGVTTTTRFMSAPDRQSVWALTSWSPPDDAPPGPFLGLEGICVGVNEFHEGSVTGDGYCNYMDEDGDTLVTRFAPTHAIADGLAFEWTAIGGTGKWEGVVGGGTSEVTHAIGEWREGRRTGRLTGRVTLRR
jgi:hypothetical protein